MSNGQEPRTIVAATDFSNDARAAVGWATEIARQHGARLVLAHALTSEALPAPEFVPLPPEYGDAIRADATRLLEEAAADARGHGIEVGCELVLSSATLGILDVAERCHADLIVAGTRGRTGWKRALLGSTAARVVRHARCPVLTVHQNDAAPPRPVRTVVVPTDFSPDAALAADTAAKILGGGPGRRLLLVHAYRVPVEAAHLPANVLLDAIRDAERIAHEALTATAERLRHPGIAVEIAARQGYPSDVILDVARTAHADLIAMGTHGRSGLERLLLGSTAEHVLPSAPCPVLTVHHREQDEGARR